MLFKYLAFSFLAIGIIADTDFILTVVAYGKGHVDATHEVDGAVGTNGGEFIDFIFEEGGYLLAYNRETRFPYGYVTVGPEELFFSIKAEATHGFTIEGKPNEKELIFFGIQFYNCRLSRLYTAHIRPVSDFPEESCEKVNLMVSIKTPDKVPTSSSTTSLDTSSTDTSSTDTSSTDTSSTDTSSTDTSSTDTSSTDTSSTDTSSTDTSSTDTSSTDTSSTDTSSTDTSSTDTSSTDTSSTDTSSSSSSSLETSSSSTSSRDSSSSTSSQISGPGIKTSTEPTPPGSVTVPDSVTHSGSVTVPDSVTHSGSVTPPGSVIAPGSVTPPQSSTTVSVKAGSVQIVSGVGALFALVVAMLV